VPFAALAGGGICAGIPAGIAVAAGRIVIQRAGGVGAGGLALAEQVVAVLGDRGGLAAGEFSPSFSCGVFRHRAVYEQKKLRSCGCFRANRGEQLPGSGATLF
jgi:hypothetical protein